MGSCRCQEFLVWSPGSGRDVATLSTIRGTLVEMPLLFLIKEDVAKEGVGLNTFTEDVFIPDLYNRRYTRLQVRNVRSKPKKCICTPGF